MKEREGKKEMRGGRKREKRESVLCRLLLGGAGLML